MRAQHSRLRRGTRRLTGWMLNLTMLLVVLACLAWIVPSALGFSRYVITGGSMEPTIHKGSVVFEKPVAASDLEVGDVITYLPPAGSGVTSLVTHRIVDMEPAEGGGVLFTTQGDANPKPDPWQFKLVEEQQPVVEASVPHVGWVFIALADRTTRMLLIGGPAALIALWSLIQVIGAMRSRGTSDAADEAGADEPQASPDRPEADAGAEVPVPALV